MTTRLYLEQILWIIAAWAAVEAVQLPVRKRCGRLIRALLWTVKFLLMIWLAFEMIADASPLFWNHGYPFSGLYLALFADLITELLGVLFLRHKSRQEAAGKLSLLSIPALLVVSLYAFVNMAVIHANELTYTSPKLQCEHRIVFLADLHYGSSQTPAAVEKALQEIEELKPEAILLGGDITDEHTTKEEMEYIYSRIGDMNIPVYFIYGNHDRQERGSYVGGSRYTPQELADTLTGNGITILKDELTVLADDLVLLGREDPSHPAERKKPEELPRHPDDAYVIALEHTPYQNDDILAQGADLQLSGHTHAGQLFPLRFIYTAVKLNTVGEYHIGSTIVYVTPGITGWFYPLRNESRCQYEVITLKPE